MALKCHGVFCHNRIAYSFNSSPACCARRHTPFLGCEMCPEKTLCLMGLFTAKIGGRLVETHLKAVYADDLAAGFVEAFCQ